MHSITACVLTSGFLVVHTTSIDLRLNKITSCTSNVVFIGMVYYCVVYHTVYLYFCVYVCFHQYMGELTRPLYYLGTPQGFIVLTPTHAYMLMTL